MRPGVLVAILTPRNGSEFSMELDNLPYSVLARAHDA